MTGKTCPNWSKKFVKLQIGNRLFDPYEKEKKSQTFKKIKNKI